MASLGLLASYGSSSESESDDDDSTSNNQSEPEASTNEKQKLPSPFLPNGNSASNDGPGLSVSASVFSNPFREAERQQTSVLEKHVKMTTPSNKVSALNGRQICWNYRKGRCRFGHNCKFAHDSDVPLENQSNLLSDTSAMQKTVPVTQQNTPSANGLENVHEEQEELELATKKRKKRSGLAQGLIPPKKALKAYFGQQSTKYIGKLNK